MEAALDTVGWIQQVIVNVTSGRVIDGHMRIESAIKHDEATVPVLYVELTDDEERAALASLDPLSAMAVIDAEQLFALTESLETGNPVLDEFLAEQRDVADGARLKGESSEPRLPQRDRAVCKAVLPASDLALLERALSKTGSLNRAEAFLTVCRSYLEHAEGQHDTRAQGVATAQPAAKAPTGPRSP